LIGRKHQTARGHDYIEGAVWEWKIFSVPCLPGDVAIALFRGTLLRDGEEFGCEVQSRDRSAARAMSAVFPVPQAMSSTRSPARMRPLRTTWSATAWMPWAIWL